MQTVKKVHYWDWVTADVPQVNITAGQLVVASNVHAISSVATGMVAEQPLGRSNGV